jgi:hypothetical protein
MSDTPQDPRGWPADDDPHPSPGAAGPPLTSTPPAPGQHWVPPVPAASTATAAPTRSVRPRLLWIVAGVAVALGLTAAAIVGLLVRRGGDDAGSTPTSSTVPSTSSAPRDPAGGAGGTGGSGVTPTPDTAPAAQSTDVVVVESGFSVGEGFDGGPAANAGVVLRNVGDRSRAFVEVVMTFVGADGAPVGTETSYVYAIDPGGTSHAAVDGVPLLGRPTELRVVVVAEQEPAFWTGTVLPVQVGPVAVDDFFGLEVSGTASNPTATDVMGAAVQCVVRRGGTIVGGTLALVAMIDAGGQATWEALTFSDWLRGDAAECSASVLD